MKKFKKLLAGVLMGAAVFMAVPALHGTDKVNAAYELSENVKYLSDMEYVTGTAKDNKLYRDRNASNKTIKLVMSTKEDEEGNAIQNIQSFIKGMGAWATSELVYEIPEGFQYFESYIGVDASNQDTYYNGGVTFRIYLSNDKAEWVEKYTSDTMKGWNDAKPVKLSLENYKYIKLKADENGNSFYSAWYDNAVYADARFTKNDYKGENIVPSQDIKTLEEYDSEIAAFSNSENLNDSQRLTVLRREYVNRIGYNILKSYYTLSNTYKSTIDWLIGDEKNLQNYLDVNLGSSENYAKSLTIMADLYTKYNSDFQDSENGELWKKMALALSCSHVNDVNFWAVGGTTNGSDAIERYNIFKTLRTAGRINTAYFDSASIPEMRIIMANQLPDDQIDWLNWYAASNKGSGEANYGSPDLAHGSYIWYNSHLNWNYQNEKYFNDGKVTEEIDKKYHLSEKNVNTSDSKLWVVMEEGAVCGGQSKTGANLRGVYGYPAFVIGQPGHAAYFYQTDIKDGNKVWTIGNNIYGWWKSEYGGNLLGWTKNFDNIRWAGATGPDGRYYTGSYLVMEQEAINKINDLRNSNLYVYMANSVSGDAEKEQLYNKALGVLPINIDAYLGVLKSYKNRNASEEEYVALAGKIAESHKYYPLAVSDLLTMIKDNFVKSNTKKVEIENLRVKALNNAKNIADSETLQPDVTRTIASSLLSTSQVEMATFSLDGDDAGKIIFDESYRKDAENTAYLYSLTGARADENGKVTIEWKRSTEGIIELTQEEIDSLTEENGILVKIEGLSDDNLFGITLTRAGKPEGLGANDDDDVVVGNAGTMQWSLDQGTTWTRFDKETPDLTGDKTVWVRNGSTKQTLFSNEYEELTFTESDEPSDRKYISALNIEVSASTNHNQNTLAENVLDGNKNTYWSSKQKEGADGYKRLVFTFDKERFVTSMEIYPRQDSSAGRIKSLEIGASQDSECTTVAVLDNRDLTDYNSNEPIVVTFDRPVYAKHIYVKENDSNNNFICLSMVKFYENRDKDPENEEDTRVDWEVDEVLTIDEKDLFINGVSIKTSKGEKYITNEEFANKTVWGITDGLMNAMLGMEDAFNIVNEKYSGIAMLQITDENGVAIYEDELVKTGMKLEVYNGTSWSATPDFTYIIVVPGDNDTELVFDDHYHIISDEWKHDEKNHWKGCDGCDEKHDEAAHVEEVKNKKDATATEEGYTGDVYCSVCERLLREGEVIEIIASEDDEESGESIEQETEQETEATEESQSAGDDVEESSSDEPATEQTESKDAETEDSQSEVAEESTESAEPTTEGTESSTGSTESTEHSSESESQSEEPKSDESEKETETSQVEDDIESQETETTSQEEEVVELDEKQLFIDGVDIKIKNDEKYLVCEDFVGKTIWDVTNSVYLEEENALNIISEQYYNIAMIQIMDKDGFVIEDENSLLSTGMKLEVYNWSSESETPDFTYILVVPGDNDEELELDGHVHKVADDWSHDKESHWKTCSGCDEKQNLENHIEETRNAKEATLTEKGYTGDIYCKVCGQLLESGSEIPVIVEEIQESKEEETEEALEKTEEQASEEETVEEEIEEATEVTEEEAAQEEITDESAEESLDQIAQEDIEKYGITTVEDIPGDGDIWIAGIEEDGYSYTGSAIKPEIRVYWKNRRLTEKTDYTISYKNNINAWVEEDNNYNHSLDKNGYYTKAPTITITGKGNYNEKEVISFNINPLDISEEAFQADDIVLAYNSKKVQKAKPVLKWGTKTLGTKDYSVAYVDEAEQDAFKEAGVYEIELTGKGNFTGERVISETITESTLMSKVTATIVKGQNLTYTGDEITPEYTLKSGKNTLTKGIDYDVEYENNTAVGTATVIFTGKGDYAGSRKATFKITGENISKAVAAKIESQSYSGEEIEPEVELSYKGEPLTIDDDYEVVYSNNTKAGTATITVKGLGRFEGTTKKVTFKITKYQMNSEDIELDVEQDVVYTKAGAKPGVVVTRDDEELKEGVDYKLSYKNNSSVKKKGTVVITGIGGYTGSRSESFDIIQKDMSLEDNGMVITAADKVYQEKANIYKTTITITDNGKKLSTSDYDAKNVEYTYAEATDVKIAHKVGKKVEYEVVRVGSGESVEANHIIPAGTEINVCVYAKANGNYDGEIIGSYRITDAALSKVAVSGTITKVYTRKGEITLEEEDFENIKVTYKKDKNNTEVLEYGEDYEIDENSYVSNNKTGTAKVSLQGLNGYGGTKTISFKITPKTIVKK